MHNWLVDIIELKNCKKTFKTIIFIVLLIGLLIFGLLLFGGFGKSDIASGLGAEKTKSCSSLKKEIKTVRGNSMTPLIKNGEEVTVYKNYQECYSIKRDDVVIYNYVGHNTPLIKSVKAIPGDSFSLKKIEGMKKERWQIIVNNELVVNSEGKIYAYSKENLKMLEIYAKDYPQIPENTYLLLADNPQNAIDSTRFGLVGGNEIIGVVARN